MKNVNLNIELVKKSRINDFEFSNIPFGKTFSDHMLVAEFNNGSWQNVSIKPYQKIEFYPSLVTLHYGQAIFEAFKVHKGTDSKLKIFRPYDNHKRFNASAERLCMPQVPEKIFIDAMIKLVEIDKQWIPNQLGDSLYIRPFMFATDEYLGVAPSSSYKFIIITAPTGKYYSKEVKVKIELNYIRAAQGGVGFAKCAGNYAGSLYPSSLAQKEGYDQILWTDAKEHEYFEESGTMNIMFLLNDVLITPLKTDSILGGITRDSIIQVAKDLKMSVEERRISVKEVIEGIEKGTLKEAFGMGTAATITSISHIGYKGKDYILPADRSTSKKLFEALQDIKLGLSEDIHSWNLNVVGDH